MKLTCESRVTGVAGSAPIQNAAAMLRRDLAKTLCPGGGPGAEIRLQTALDAMPPESYTIAARPDENVLAVTAGDSLGAVYGLLEVSRRFLGVQPFWFWCDQRFVPCASAIVPDDCFIASTPARVRYRGWFINDETLLSHWPVARRPEGAWEMALEALLRCGGNLVIPGTGENARKYRDLARDYGLILTHHHAEPLGAEMFVHAYPNDTPSFDRNAEKFRALWREAVEAQKNRPVVWNIGFRGQGDCPFWNSDPQYDTPEKRGALISALMREQYSLVKAADPAAVCCTNLYGETMELYQQGWLKLPEDVIKIWADNGYGKMVSRRQGNYNPRVPALPPKGDTGAHGLYYHASFYDLQAASHITMLPNSAELVCDELGQALDAGVDDYWLINCSNIKPHTYLLDYIAQLWQKGSVNTAAHRMAYAAAYYGKENVAPVADCLAGYADAAIPYGPHRDDCAGDQFYNHVPRMLISQFMADRTARSGALEWLTGAGTLREQAAYCAKLYAQARENYGAYLRRCESAAAGMQGAARTLFQDTLLLQAQLYALWAEGASAVCAALEAGFDGDWQEVFYQAGLGKRAYTLANRAMRDREHGKWIDFYANECQTDVKQTAALCGYLMSFARNIGEGPHFYEWQRQFQDSEADRRVLVILNTENHPTDDELWRLMEQWREV